MAFGKRSVVKSNIWNYSIGLIGESGIGKTTTIAKVCEKLVGEDGYILLDVGKEWGVGAINGVTYEEVPDYKTWDAITKDIIGNKDSEYPNLRLIIADTLDQLFDLAEKQSIKAYNAENINKKDFVKSATINTAWGGFGRGEDYAIKLILDRVEALRNVGVMFWFTGHTKTREIVDPLTGGTFTSLTTNMMQRYFNAIKTKTDILGVACIDREVVKEELGRKNIITKKEETRNKVISESRKVKFRDENYCVDSKSRFAAITPEINLDADEFIKAIQAAIDAATSEKEDAKPVIKKATAAKSTAKKPEPKPEPAIIDSLDDDVEFGVDPNAPKNDEPEVDVEDIRAKFKVADDEVRENVKAVMKRYGAKKLESLNSDALAEIAALL